MSVEQLEKMLGNEDWFAYAANQDNKYIVYVDYMNLEVFNKIPRFLNERQVLVHFDNSALLDNKYVNIVDSDNLDLDENELNLAIKDMLSSHSVNTVESVFYEVHDGENAVTNIASRFPELKETLTILYNKYGFDLLYDALELK